MRLFILLLSLLISSANTPSKGVTEINPNFVKSSKKVQKVYSYEDVLEKYFGKYKLIIDLYNEKNPSQKVDYGSFNDFVNDYYSLDVDLTSYPEYYASKKIGSSTPQTYQLKSSSSGIENYILNGGNSQSMVSQEYFSASDFKSKPVYEMYDFQSFANGNIIFENTVAVAKTGHVAIVENASTNSDYGYFVKTIESVPNQGVTYGFVDDYRMAEFKVEVLRVANTTSSEIQKALYFCRSQIGGHYSIDSVSAKRIQTGYESNSGAPLNWYCSELIFAAFLHADSSIDYRLKSLSSEDLYNKEIIKSILKNGKFVLGNYKVKNSNNITSDYSAYDVGTIFPIDIYLSNNVYGKVLNKRNFFPNFYINAKNGNVWNIEISNQCSLKLTIFYNTKMAYYNDGKAWSGLKDISSFELNGYGRKSVDIVENWLADAIVASVVIQGTRYITVANKLNNDSKTLSIGNYII